MAATSNVFKLDNSSKNLLARLPPDDFKKVFPLGVRKTPLKARRVLHFEGQPMDHVYFIETGLVSVLASTTPGGWQEAWLIGPGGLAGVPAILGSQDSTYRRVVHTPGTGIKMTIEEFQAGMKASPAFCELLQGFLLATLFQVAQCSVCNSAHSVPQRLARWLLLAAEPGGPTALRVTQESIARMLGVRRATINECLGKLERDGALAMDRASITIADWEKLQATACHCYDLIARKRRRTELHYEARHRSACSVEPRDF